MVNMTALIRTISYFGVALNLILAVQLGCMIVYLNNLVPKEYWPKSKELWRKNVPMIWNYKRVVYLGVTLAVIAAIMMILFGLDNSPFQGEMIFSNLSMVIYLVALISSNSAIFLTTQKYHEDQRILNLKKESEH